MVKLQSSIATYYLKCPEQFFNTEKIAIDLERQTFCRMVSSA
jgi:hypothetical protein